MPVSGGIHRRVSVLVSIMRLRALAKPRCGCLLRASALALATAVAAMLGHFHPASTKTLPVYRWGQGLHRTIYCGDAPNAGLPQDLSAYQPASEVGYLNPRPLAMPSLRCPTLAAEPYPSLGTCAGAAAAAGPVWAHIPAGGDRRGRAERCCCWHRGRAAAGATPDDMQACCVPAGE